MSKAEYGTKEYYKECFQDFLGDVGGGTPTDVETALTILAAFREAVQDWIDYHEHCAETYQTLLNTFLDDNWGTTYGPVDEELALPSIPEFPTRIRRGECDV